MRRRGAKSERYDMWHDWPPREQQQCHHLPRDSYCKWHLHGEKVGDIIILGGSFATKRTRGA